MIYEASKFGYPKSSAFLTCRPTLAAKARIMDQAHSVLDVATLEDEGDVVLPRTLSFRISRATFLDMMTARAPILGSQDTTK